MPMPLQLARGQRTRGRRKSQPRMVLEELPTINANWLSRRKLFPKDWTTRRYSFDFQNPAVIRSLTLGPRCAEFVFVNGQMQFIPIVWSRIDGLWRSARAAFQCPGCGRNAFKCGAAGPEFSRVQAPPEASGKATSAVPGWPSTWSRTLAAVIRAIQ